MATRNVTIRLSVKDGEIVRRALEQLGADGQRALKRIENASAPASKGLLALNAATKEGKSYVHNYAASAGPLGSVLTAVGPAGLAAAAGIGAITLGIGAALRVTQQALEDFDKIAKTADKLGIATDALQEYRFIASQSGVAQQTLDMGLQRLTRRAGDAARGIGEAVKVFDSLNVKVLDASGNLRPMDDIFNDVADSIAGMDGDAEKLSATVKLVDSEAAGMVNLFRRGSESIEEMRRQARAFGFVVDEHVLRNVEATNDRLDVLNRIVDVNLKRSFLELAPILETTAKAMAGVSMIVSEIVDNFKEIEDKSTNKLYDNWIESLEKLQKWEGVKQKVQFVGYGGASVTYDPEKERKKINAQITDIEKELRLRGFEIKLSPEAKEILKNPFKGVGKDLRNIFQLKHIDNTTVTPTGEKKTKDYQSILDPLENEYKRLGLIKEGKDAEAEALRVEEDVLRIKERLKGASQEEIDKAVALTYAIHNIKQAIADKNKVSIDGNAKVIESLKEQLRLEKLAAEPGGEREAFVQKELKKLDEKATPEQFERTRQTAGDVFDYRETQKQQKASDSVLESNRKIVASIQEQLRVERIRIEEGEEAAAVYRAMGRIAADATGLQTDKVLEQIQAVKDLMAQLQSLRDIQNAKDLTERHLDPKERYAKEIQELNRLRETGELSARAYAEEFEAAYDRMLVASDDAWSGMERGARRFVEYVGTAADQVERVFGNALNGVSDLLTQVLGKGEFDAASLLSTLRMSAAREVSDSFVSNAIKPMFLSLNLPFGGKRHSGGPVEPDVTYLIKKDEAFFTPDRPGVILTEDSYERFPQPDFRSINQSVANHTNNTTTHKGTSVGKIEINQQFYSDGSSTADAPGFNASRYQILQELSRDLQSAGRRV